MKYKTLLFDADNTLFDFDKAEKKAVQKLLSHYHRKLNPELFKSYRKINDILWKKLEEKSISSAELKKKRFELFFTDNDIQSDGNWSRISSEYLNFLAEGAILFRGSYGLCRKLYRKGFEILIVTNGLKEVQRKRLELSRIKGFVSRIIVSDEVGFAKPDKRFFDLVLSGTHTKNPQDCLIIGDSLSADIQGGKEAGIDSCWFNPFKAENPGEVLPDYEIHRLKDLLPLVD